MFSGRLDNLCSVYCGLRALLDTCETESSLSEETTVRMLAVFDHEEVGSRSAPGAGSNLLPEGLRRIARTLGQGQADVVERAGQNSFLISADMAHGLHPNYPAVHEGNHQPLFHKGVVIKSNANQRYATTAVTSYLFKEMARLADVPVQVSKREREREREREKELEMED